MAIIFTYPSATPASGARVLGTDPSKNNATVSYPLDGLADFVLDKAISEGWTDDWVDVWMDLESEQSITKKILNGTSEPEVLWEEDFSGGVFGPEFSFDGDSDWTVDIGIGPDGGNAATSGPTNDSSYSSLKLTVTTTAEISTLSYDFSQNTEACCDYLIVLLNGIELYREKDLLTGPVYVPRSFKVFGAEEHVIEFRYAKDSNTAANSDNVQITNLKIESAASDLALNTSLEVGGDIATMGSMSIGQSAGVKENLTVEDTVTARYMTTKDGLWSTGEINIHRDLEERVQGPGLRISCNNKDFGQHDHYHWLTTYSQVFNPAGTLTTVNAILGAGLLYPYWSSTPAENPVATLGLTQHQYNNVTLVAQTAANGGYSNINSKLQIGYSRNTPDLGNPHVLSVAGSGEFLDEVTAEGFIQDGAEPETVLMADGTMRPGVKINATDIVVAGVGSPRSTTIGRTYVTVADSSTGDALWMRDDKISKMGTGGQLDLRFSQPAGYNAVTIPDATGTLALLSDIPAVGADVLKDADTLSPVTAINKLITQDDMSAPSGVVLTTTNQSVAGEKTFTDDIHVESPQQLIFDASSGTVGTFTNIVFNNMYGSPSIGLNYGKLTIDGGLEVTDGAGHGSISGLKLTANSVENADVIGNGAIRSLGGLSVEKDTVTGGEITLGTQTADTILTINSNSTPYTFHEIRTSIDNGPNSAGSLSWHNNPGLVGSIWKTQSPSGYYSSTVQMVASGGFTINQNGTYSLVIVPTLATFSGDIAAVNGTFSGDSTAVDHINTSDRRLKEDIKDYEPKAIDVRWREYKLKASGETQLGVIADELESTNPEFVVKGKTENDMDSVKYLRLLIAKVAELENRIKELEK